MAQDLDKGGSWFPWDSLYQGPSLGLQKNYLPPWINVLFFGADPTATFDSSAAIQNAINFLTAGGGGVVYFPPGKYKCTGINANINITLQGAGRTATYLWCGNADAIVVTLGSGGQNFIRDMSIFGKGAVFLAPDTGTFGGTTAAVRMQSSGGGIYNTQIFGGLVALNVSATDAVFFNVICDNVFGQELVLVTGACWWYHCKFDHSNTGATGLPGYSAWLSTHAYNKGDSVTVGSSAVLVATVAGTSGSVQPSPANYGVNIPDGTVTWQYQQNSVNLSAIVIQGGAGENHFHQVDMSGPFNSSISVQNIGSSSAVPVTVLTDCILGAGAAVLNAGSWFMIHGGEISGTISIATSYTGKFSIQNCWWNASSGGVTIAANVSGFNISDNLFNAGAVTIAAGTSDHYIVTNNIGATITDSAGGAHSITTGNVA